MLSQPSNGNPAETRRVAVRTRRRFEWFSLEVAVRSWLAAFTILKEDPVLT